MWFHAIFLIINAVLDWVVGKVSFKTVAYGFSIPIWIIYIPLLTASFVFFMWGLLNIFDSLFDFIALIKYGGSGSSGSGNNLPVFACFWYLLDALGIRESLETGAALILSNLLIIMLHIAYKSVITYNEKLLKVIKNVGDV
jgi:hypothetical protein